MLVVSGCGRSNTSKVKRKAKHEGEEEAQGRGHCACDEAKQGVWTRAQFAEILEELSNSSSNFQLAN